MFDAPLMDIVVRFCEESFAQRVMKYLSDQLTESLTAIHST